jgi:hypothetical protein
MSYYFWINHRLVRHNQSQTSGTCDIVIFSWNVMPTWIWKTSSSLDRVEQWAESSILPLQWNSSRKSSRGMLSLRFVLSSFSYGSLLLLSFKMLIWNVMKYKCWQTGKESIYLLSTNWKFKANYDFSYFLQSRPWTVQRRRFKRERECVCVWEKAL